jgi:hypothetical protein
MIAPTALGRRFLQTTRAFGRPEVGFQLAINSAKKMFFDRTGVMEAFEGATRHALSRFGYFTMRDARQSIRKRKKASAPGQPPTNQTGLLKRFIFFSYDTQRHSVIVGPTRLEGYIRVLMIPRVLEEGGMSRLTYQTRLTGVGDTSRIRGHQGPNSYGKEVRIRPRPYMKPAFDRQKATQLPHLWRDAFRR